MGRKSALTDEQWIEIERRHVVDGHSINALAAEFGVNESSLRRKIKPNKAGSPNAQNSLVVIANSKIRADAESKRIAEQIAELPYAKQQIVSDLTRKLVNTSEHLAGTAEYGASTAHRLAGIANAKSMEIDDARPLDDASREALKDIMALTRTANEAASTGLNLIAANKEMVARINESEKKKPLTLGNFYGDE